MKKLLTVLLVIAVICTFSFGSAFATVNYTAGTTHDKIAVDEDFFNKTVADYSNAGSEGLTGSLGITTAEGVYLANAYDYTVYGIKSTSGCTCTAEAKEIKAVYDALLADLAKATTSKEARKLENAALKNVKLIHDTYVAYKTTIENNALIEIDRTTDVDGVYLLKGYGYVQFAASAVADTEYALKATTVKKTTDPLVYYPAVNKGADLMIEWLLDNGYTTKASLAAGTAKLFAALEDGKTWTAELSAAYKEAKAAVKTVNTATASFGSQYAATSSLDDIEAALAKVDAYNEDFCVANNGNVGISGVNPAGLETFTLTGWGDGLAVNGTEVVTAAKLAIENLLVTDYAGIKALNKNYALLTDAEKAEVVKQVRSIAENTVAFESKYDYVDATTAIANTANTFYDLAKAELNADDNISQLYVNFAQIVNAKEGELTKLSGDFYVTYPEVTSGYTGSYTFDSSDDNLAAIKDARAAFDALVADYGWTLIAGYRYTPADSLSFLEEVGAFEARILAAEYNVKAVAGIDKKNDADDSVAIQAYLNNATVKVTSSKLAAKKVRVQAKVDTADFVQLMALVDGQHYTVNYKFYHKAPGKSFKATKTKDVNYITYTSKSLKTGKNSFRVGIVVKDAKGNVVAEKSYKASTLAYRTIK